MSLLLTGTDVRVLQRASYLLRSSQPPCALAPRPWSCGFRPNVGLNGMSLACRWFLGIPNEPQPHQVSSHVCWWVSEGTSQSPARSEVISLAMCLCSTQLDGVCPSWDLSAFLKTQLFSRIQFAFPSYHRPPSNHILEPCSNPAKAVSSSVQV